ncbi:hypothetical protein CK203_032269 [Vitis vinifera]|uniref:Uncharacterized protein n=1 Tax=Vitis vinifera TaxID=29760 RepID=A0A438IJP9_VITVI|nr:hypothetical protein CK203_032269 [Vitis vinifera]
MVVVYLELLQDLPLGLRKVMVQFQALEFPIQMVMTPSIVADKASGGDDLWQGGHKDSDQPGGPNLDLSLKL